MSFNLQGILRRDLNEIIAYEAPRVGEGIVKLDANENPFEFPEDIIKETCERLKSFTRYPDPMSAELIAALSEYTGVPKEGIMAGNGSDELILNILLVFGNGGHVIIPTPTFSMYRIHSLIAGAKPVEVSRGSKFEVDVSAVAETCKSCQARAVIVCSPNNPTANATPVEDIQNLLEQSEALIVVDEAYIDFGGESCLKLLNSYPNLVILRTFSKAFGLAGLRVGYLLGNPEVVKEIHRVKQPFNLNIFSQLAARTVLSNNGDFKLMVNKIIETRDKLIEEMSVIKNVTVYPSEANFIFFRTQLRGKEVFDGLLKKGVLIRNVHAPGIEDCLRVTVGRENENKLFLDSLQAVLNGNGAPERTVTMTG
ncbi:MAG TPA: histidinol-phosphate transaminase [Desulfotomaculum sp.]|nr:MAG: Histidinol-phosphate aminotransferase [Desulfotomaculum sp. 46_80]KUK84964.1 MAG: Histidinol-phosphate aminotransferase [Desulfofundulus kuznetsovii]HAG10743.1 histidinol-phosphate transaminase [Desulfotomaculum sp.]HBY03914.1 histidinol-phosphate transaminase [Desulfotomaculum sp.]